MKTKLLLLSCLFVSITCRAQYPAPLNFQMSYRYILLDESGPCCGLLVTGPTYCTDFQWEAPGLSGTEAKLTGYNIYYYETMEPYAGMDIPASEVRLIAQTTNTYLQMEIGILGIVWVTAVYSDPEGESQSSNYEINAGLPTSIQEVEKPDISIVYNKRKDNIEILGINDITSVRIVRTDGTIIRSVSSSDLYKIDTKGIEKGIYIIDVTTKDAGSITRKITIK
jgi:hypothetical protein